MKQLETNPKFILSECRERTAMYLLEKNNTNIKIDKYTKIQGKEQYDVIFTSGQTFTEEVVEVKVRNYYSNQFNDYVLEKRKIDSILSQNESFLYMCFFYDRVIAWKINIEEEYIFEDKEYKKYTDRDSSMEIKKCLMLNRNDACIDEPLTFNYSQLTELAENHFNKKYKVTN